MQKPRYSPADSAFDETIACNRFLSNYCTSVDIADGLRLDLFTPSMLRMRVSTLPGERFPAQYQIPFAIGKYEQWQPVRFSRTEDAVFVYVTTGVIQVRIFKQNHQWLVWDAAGQRQICPSSGPLRGMFRDGYTMFDAASHFNETNRNSRFSRRFYNPQTGRYDIWLEAEALHDTYFIYGPDYPALFRQYNELVGPEPLLPRKAFGFFQTQHAACKGSQQKTMDVIETFDKLEMPLDTLILDFEWGDGCDGGKEVTWGDRLEWSSSYETPLSPAQFVEWLRKKNITLMLIHHSVPRYPGQEGRAWTQRKCEWDTWWEALESKLQIGVAGTWQDTRANDMTDHFIYKGLQQRTGKRPYFLGNYEIYENCSWTHLKEPLPSHACIGARRTPFHWVGDEDDTWCEYMWKIEAVTNSRGSMRGISYLSTDVRCEDWELQARWNQFNDFTGISRTHTQKPWRDVETQDAALFAFGDRAPAARATAGNDASRTSPEQIACLLDSIRTHRLLRYRLLPYIYATAWENYTTGMPLCRPMILAFPDDRNCNEDQYPYQYLFGPALLVAPFYQRGAGTISMYLPGGSQWIDYWERRVLEGGQTITLSNSADKRLPLFVRRGAILPMQEPSLRISPAPPGTVILDIYPHGRSECVLYDDDGETMEYQSGRYGLTRLSCDQSAGEIRVAVSRMEGDFSTRPSRRTYRIQLNLLDVPPESVIIDGSPAGRTPDIISAGLGQWSYEPSTRSLNVVCEADTSAGLDVVVRGAALAE